MKVLFAITNLSTGGAETVLFNLLENIDRKRFQPIVISLVGPGEFGPKIQALGIPVVTLNMGRRFPSPKIIFRLIKLLLNIKPDVIHTWMYHADLIVGLAARLIGHKKIIWGVHHSNLSAAANKRSTLLVVKACALLSHHLPSKIQMCSHFAMDIHKKIGYATEKLQVIPNGFNLSKFAPSPVARSSIRRQLNLPPDTPLVGLIARFDPLKNHLGFVEAAAIVNKYMPAIHFLLAGTGVDDSNTELKDAIKMKNLVGHIHLLGRRDDVPRLMASLDVLALSSNGESFGNVLCEAMACEVPCVTTDSGGPAEVVGNTGVVVEVGDMNGLAQGILDILSLPGEHKAAIGLSARDRVAKNYEISEVTKMYENLYEQVLSKE